MPIDATQFLKGLGAARERALQAALRAVDQFAESPVLGDAQEACPKKTTFLASSGTAETPAKMSADGIVKEVGFNADYAVYVHENLNANHENGQAKFLELSMRANTPKLGPYVARKIKEALG